MTRIAHIRAISFCLVAACRAFCQNEHPAPDFRFKDGSNSSEVRQEPRTWRALPDAPLEQPPIKAEKFQTFIGEARSPFTPDAIGIYAGGMRKTEQNLNYGPQTRLTALYNVVPIQKEPSSTFLGKYLFPPLLKQNLRYQPSTSGSFMGRATHAALRLFVMRNDSGKRRVNTSYFFEVLSSVAIHAAYRPYWARSTSATFNDFGSTVGSDAGVNLLHEFGPGIRLVVKHHTPKFIFRIEERINHDQNPRAPQHF